MTCRAVMMAKRHGHGDRVAGDRADDRIEQPRQRRLADPPERQG